MAKPMRALTAVLIAVASALPVNASTFVFRETPGEHAILGYLNTDTLPGLGLLAFPRGYFRLTGFDEWTYSGIVRPNPGQHVVLLVNWAEPWICGFIVWRGDYGLLDIFSADGKRCELSVRVERVSYEPGGW